MEILNLLRQGAKIIDVRTQSEFMGGHVAGAINIPLGELEKRMSEIREIKEPLILCCLSGGRSGQACSFLQAHNIECTNGGSWFHLNKATQEVL